MLRRTLALAVLNIAFTLPSGGCRSCSSCHDYDPPVANCDCPGGVNRAGSNSTCGCGCGGGCESGQCCTGGTEATYAAPSACGCGNH